MAETGRVAIIGAGIMGPGIAQVFAAHGWRVQLLDLKAETLTSARLTLKTNLDLMRELGLAEEAEIRTILGCIETSLMVEAGIAEADLVIEAVTESRAVKTQVLDTIGRVASRRALVWSNTSTLDVFALAPENLQSRMLIAHWFAPPHILPLVEIVKGARTAPEVVQHATDLLKAMGRTPVLMESYVPGFVINRLLRALGREAFYLIDNGYITAQNLDLAVRASLAARMMVLGVVQRYDFTGLDLSARNLENPDFMDAPVDLAPKSLAERVADGDLGVKTGRGFYDYDGLTLQEASRKRDEKLWQVVNACRDMTVKPRVV